MKPHDGAVGGPAPAYYENIVTELERIAQMLRDRPELNHHAAERLLQIARDIRSDVDRITAVGNQPDKRSGN